MPPLTILLILLTLVTLCLLGLRNPVYSLCAYAFLYLNYNGKVWWVGPINKLFMGRPSLILFLILLISSALNYKKLNFRINRGEVYLWLFFIVLLLSTQLGIGMDDDNWYLVNKIFKIYIVLFFMVRILDTEKNFSIFVGIIIMSALFLSYQGYVSTQSYFHSGRLDSLGGVDFQEGNGLAAFLSIAICFISVEVLRRGLLFSLLITIPAALILNTVIMTQSRAVLLGLIAAVPFSIYYVPKKHKKKVVMYILLGGILFFMLADISFIERMQSMDVRDEERIEKTTNTRIPLWIAAAKLIQKDQFGVGAGNFHKAIGYIEPNFSGLDAHNTYIRCYSELGIQGILLYLFILFRSFFLLCKITKNSRNKNTINTVCYYSYSLILVYVIYFFGYGTTHTALYKEIVFWLFALPLCLENIYLKRSSTIDQ